MVQRAPDRDWVCVAAVAAAHGLRGALKLRCFTERAEDVAAYGPVLDQNARRLFELEVIGRAPGGVLARAQGVEDRSTAEALRGTELYVPRSALPEPGTGRVLPQRSRRHGGVARRWLALRRVRGVDNFGAGDLIEMVADDGRTCLACRSPAHRAGVDLAQRRLVVEPPAELLAEATSGARRRPGRRACSPCSRRCSRDRSAIRWPARRCRRRWRSRRSTSATSRPTSIARSTTRRSAAAPAW